MENNYKTEAEFLKNYNSDEFEKLSLTTDILIFSVSSEESNNYRKTDTKKMSILLVKRDNYPFKDKWCLPGGFVDIDEDLDEAPKRILKREANLDNIYLEQLYTFGKVNRDPRMRVISTSYMALIDKNKLTKALSANSAWFDIESFEESKDNIKIILNNDTETITFTVNKVLKDKTNNQYSYETVLNNQLAFDHDLVILTALNRLRNKVEYTDIVFNMMPELFTLGELQQVYEVILGKKLLDPAFRRIIANKVEKTSKMKTGGGHRPSALFKYKNKNTSKQKYFK